MFVRAYTGLVGRLSPGSDDSALAWGDYDADGDLDLVYCGRSPQERLTGILRNDLGTFNNPPGAPSGLAAIPGFGAVTFSWLSADDQQTPASGLSYNLRVGTAPGKSDVFSAMANPLTGDRVVAALGNAQKGLSWTLNGLPYGDYYWSVQSIDAAFTGSPWVQEKVFAYGESRAADAKILPDGDPILLKSMVITAVFDGFVYVETADRTCGIRVERANHGLTAGTIVDIAGVAQTNSDGERLIAATTISVTGSGTVAPLGVTLSQLGGGRFGLQSGVWGWVYLKDDNGKPIRHWMMVGGLNTVGLLVKTWGKVVFSGQGYLSIDDGSGLNVKCILPPSAAAPTEGRLVCLTGISSCQRVNGEVLRTMIVRYGEDISLLH